MKAGKTDGHPAGAHFKRDKKMKITKSNLIEIIKEEIAIVTTEAKKDNRPDREEPDDVTYVDGVATTKPGIGGVPDKAGTGSDMGGDFGIYGSKRQVKGNPYREFNAVEMAKDMDMTLEDLFDAMGLKSSMDFFNLLPPNTFIGLIGDREVYWAGPNQEGTPSGYKFWSRAKRDNMKYGE